jgi:acyl-homoserine lactone acylase PvdQ
MHLRARYLFVILIFQHLACSQVSDKHLQRYKKQASNVTIIRDTWGVPHVYGKTDADAVFGLMYAQCEESFERVERNYIERLGRLAEIDGEQQLYSDLQMRLLYDTAAAIADYRRSPEWLKKLLHAFADGVNYYIYLHPRKPLLLLHFEPWFPLMFTDGGYTATQTGGLGVKDVQSFYGNASDSGTSMRDRSIPTQLTGSNAFAIAPSRSASKNALLYINPHVSFYFRSEMHMVSDEGLNTYGAVTWGQFFVFQGFNENCGWMHTSSLADAADVYEEKISKQGNGFVYEYDGKLKKAATKQHTLHYKNGGDVTPLAITAYYTHHGPVMGKRSDKWLSLKERNRSLDGLMQSWLRTKARDYNEYEKTLLLRSNNSTNTLYADNKGNIAYWHGNFIPVRNVKYDWSQPVDGSTSSTEWKGTHELNDIVHVKNPKQGWLQNCNSTPFSAAGINSIPPNRYPAYMAPDGENFRSLFAIKELAKENNFTADKLISLGYSNYLAAFDSLLPPLFKAYDALPATDASRQALQEPMAVLKSWDKRSSISSVGTTIAVEWGLTLLQYKYKNLEEEPAMNQVNLFASFAKETSPEILLAMLKNVIDGLSKYYGTWKTPWGEINRYQRNSGSVHQEFSDAEPSVPVGIASALFGSLPSYETAWSGTKKGYGVAGNSFVAVVEFGAKVKARSIITGGQSFDKSSKHFTDQAQMYINGKFKDVFFYKEDVVAHAERTYHPGE